MTAAEPDQPDTAAAHADQVEAPANDTTPSGDGGDRGAARATDTAPESDAVTQADAVTRAAMRRPGGVTAMIAVLLALLGFALAIQVKNNTPDQSLANARQEDLLRVLSELDNAEERLQRDIATLQQTRDDLISGAADRKAALEEAQDRADELGILAGTLPATGPGITVRFEAGAKPIQASALLDAVQELRGAGAEAMQLDAGGGSVRIVTSSSFSESPTGAIWVDGLLLTGPYTLSVIGDPQALIGAVTFLNGVQASVANGGGTVTYSDPGVVSITTLRSAPDLRFAQPVS